MILLRNVPFEQQLQFLRSNICPLSEKTNYASLPIQNHTVFSEGILSYHAFLNRFYTDDNCSEITDDDDDKKYLDYTFTMYFLYACFTEGVLTENKDTYRLEVDKKSLQKNYKKGNISFRIQHITHHGVEVTFMAGDNEVSSFRKADKLVLTYSQHPAFIPAVKWFVDRAVLIERSNKVMYQDIGAFIKGDVDAVFGIKSIYRDSLNPYRSDILRTVGDYKAEWIHLVDRLRAQCQLLCTGFLHHYACPSWGVSWFKKGKKPLLIFTLSSNIVFVEFTVPVESAEQIILDRQNYSQNIRGRIEGFHCINCPKQCKGTNIVKIDGVSLCTGRAEARRIYTTLSTPEDFASIHAMLDII